MDAHEEQTEWVAHHPLAWRSHRPWSPHGKRVGMAEGMNAARMGGRSLGSSSRRMRLTMEKQLHTAVAGTDSAQLEQITTDRPDAEEVEEKVP